MPAPLTSSVSLRAEHGESLAVLQSVVPLATFPALHCTGAGSRGRGRQAGGRSRIRSKGSRSRMKNKGSRSRIRRWGAGAVRTLPPGAALRSCTS